MRVKNWDRFQHYRNRKPPWIRLYRDLLDDPEFFELSGDAVKHLLVFWLIASEDPNMDGKLPAVKVLAFRLRTSIKNVESSIAELSHWLELDASDVLADCQQHATPDQIRSEADQIRGRSEAEVDAGVPPDAPTPRKKPKKVRKNTRAAKSTETWEAYAAAYCDRYGTDPVRNAKSNSLCCQLVDRLGATEAPRVVCWYLQSRNSYYERQGHSLKALVADAEKLRTEWATGKQVTAKLETPQQRQRREQIEAADRRIREAEEREKNNGDGTLCVEGRTTIHGRISQDGDLG